jgi:hypothetical protein
MGLLQQQEGKGELPSYSAGCTWKWCVLDTVRSETVYAVTKATAG